MTTFAIDPTSQFAHNIASYAGPAGEQWMRQLPECINRLAERWQLIDILPFNNLSFNFVAQATQAGQQVVLKIGWDNQAMGREIGWLTHFEKQAAIPTVRVLAKNSGDTYLMPRLVPGISLDHVSDESATEIIGQCIQGLTKMDAAIPQEPAYPSLHDWFEQLTQASDASKRTLGNRIERASSLARELTSTAETQLLHGDLHHTNVLKDRERWVVTDPHGVIGDPVHECAAMLRNALDQIAGDISEGIQRRVNQLANTTGFDASRIAAWGYAQNVLSCVWSLDANPNADVSAVIAVVDALHR